MSKINILSSRIKDVLRSTWNISRLRKLSLSKRDVPPRCTCTDEIIKKSSPKSGKLKGSASSSPSWVLWKSLSLFAAIPAILALSGLVISTHKEIERPEFVPYEHLRIRNKRFPWGDGQKSLFHNSRVNPLPDGYEETEDDVKEGGTDEDGEEAE